MAHRKKTPIIIASIVALLVIIALIGAGVWGVVTYQANRKTQTARQQLANDGNKTATEQENVIANVAEKVSPSVVSITTSVQQQSFFGIQEGEAAGTGIIVSRDGYILTNKHVLSGANDVQIVTSNGKTYTDVTIVGMDPLNDVAYLKVNGVKDFQPAELGDSSTLRVGQTVIAIGNSLGQYQNTVTSGIISGKGRPVTAGDGSGQGTETLTDLLQTDAAINPGNSGGPLLNRAGQVIGINTAVAQNAEGIGFAIPINATKGTLKSVLDGKGVKRAYLGVRYLPITPEVVAEYNLRVNRGAYVLAGGAGEAVQAGGPAAKAGIRDKDIITKINGADVGVIGGVSSLVGEYAPGETISIELLRGGRTMTVRVTLGSYTG